MPPFRQAYRRSQRSSQNQQEHPVSFGRAPAVLVKVVGCWVPLGDQAGLGKVNSGGSATDKVLPAGADGPGGNTLTRGSDEHAVSLGPGEHVNLSENNCALGKSLSLGFDLSPYSKPDTDFGARRSVIFIVQKNRSRRAQHYQSQSQRGGLARFGLGRRSQKKNRDRWMIRSTELRPVHQRVE